MRLASNLQRLLFAVATRTLKPGETFFVPEGTPHWSGINGGKLVMLTMHVPGCCLRTRP